MPNNPVGADFRTACNNHDICYGTCGSNKKTCDSTFLGELNAACDKKFNNFWGKISHGLDNCYIAAGIYYGAVALGGSGAFNSAQQAACDCCMPPPTGP